ncbi:hypothetical protein SNEBB_008481 [Seison nebaliae]|nr:hypothetical protein SNEBB_008481 [Seison nebaliae]
MIQFSCFRGLEDVMEKAKNNCWRSHCAELCASQYYQMIHRVHLRYLIQNQEQMKTKTNMLNIDNLLKRTSTTNRHSKEIPNQNNYKTTTISCLTVKNSRQSKTINSTIKKLFHCPKCTYSSNRRNNLKRHITTIHPEYVQTSYYYYNFIFTGRNRNALRNALAK